MNNFRLSNKKIHKDDRSTIENLHEEKMKNILDKYDDIPKKRIKLNSLIETYNILNKSKESDKLITARTIKLQIEELQKELNDIDNNIELMDYLYNAKPFIENFEVDNDDNTTDSINNNNYLKSYDEINCIDNFENFKNLDNDDELSNKQFNMLDFINKTGKTNKGSDYQKYVEVCFMNRCYNNNRNNLVCKLCKNMNQFEIDHKTAHRICTICGNTETFIENNENSLYYSDTSRIDNVVQPFSYQRKNHFKEWLYQLQAKEVTQIPETVIELLLLELKKERITDNNLIDADRIKRYLKKLKLNKYYEHIPNIIRKITNKPPLNITQDFEEVLLDLFDKIQEPFDKYCPKTRKNFLSYSYTIHKFCQLLGKDDYLIYFPLLKSREKLFEQEKIWKNICNHLGWKFKASV